MRTYLRRALAIAALIVAVALVMGVAAGSGLAAVAVPAAAPAGAAPAAAMPPLTEAVCAYDGATNTRTCDLWALAGSLTMPDGESVPVWGFATDAAGPALVPGPIIRANAGETLEIVLRNEIAGETVSLAFPGQEGVIPDVTGVGAGETATYTLTVSQPGTFLYEAGLTPGGARQVAMGLYGPLTVGPSAAAYDQEAVLVFSEIDPALNTNPAGFMLRDFQPRYWLINGLVHPATGTIDVGVGSTVLLRYLNAGARSYSIGLLGLDQQVVAADGEGLPFPRGAMAESLASGQTKDVLVTIPGDAPTGTLYPLYNASLHQHNNNQRRGSAVAFGGMLTFLNVTDGTPPAFDGPVASNVSLDPAKTNGTVDVTLSATLTDADSDVVAYEYFIDVVGDYGTGIGDSVGPAPSVSVSATVSVAQLEALAGGQHTFYIRGQDALGNWGQFGSAVLTLDVAGPNITGLSLAPNPTNGTVNVALSATADDRANGNSGVVDAQYRIDGGAWQAMALAQAGAPVSALTATIDAATVAGLTEGARTVEVQAQDELGNWTATPGAITLTVDMTGPAAAVTLNPTTFDVDSAPTTVRLTATLTDALTTVANAEAFIGTAGAQGTGIALFPSDGLFDETVEDAYYNIPAVQFTSMGTGTHTVYVFGLDKAGNWGVAGTATVEVTSGTPVVTGPVISNLSASPNPTLGSNRLTLTATATDPASTIAAAEWWEGADPGEGNGSPMSAVDRRFSSSVEAVTASFNINSWSLGDHQVSVRARNAAGIWGTPATITVTKTTRQGTTLTDPGGAAGGSGAAFLPWITVR